MWKRHLKATFLTKLLDPVAHFIARYHFLIGSRLNQKTKGWTRTQQKIFLMLFVSCVAGVSILQLYHDEQRIRVPDTPKPAPMQHQDTTFRKSSLSPQDSIYIKLFHQKLEQLQSTQAGRDSLREFIKQRPGYIDSVLRWEQVMKQQY